MKLSFTLLIALVLSVCQNSLNAQNLLHHWNFNDITSYANHIAPSSTIGGAQLDTLMFAGGASLLDFANGTNADLSQNLNARNSDASGTHLRFNNPIFGALIFSLPTTGYKNIEVKYASVRSGSGAYLQFVHYTTDGTNYTLYDTMRPNTSTGQQIFTVDLKSVPAVNNNPNFKIKITFGQGGGGTAGNNRFDNFTVDGSIIPTPVLVHYWNFNDNSSIINLTNPTQSTVSGASIAHNAGGISAIDFAGGTGQNFNIDNFNARNGDLSGAHLRFNDPIGGGLVFALPTTGHENIVVSFTTRRSSSGAGAQLWYYTTDGSNYTFLDTTLPNNGNPTLITKNLTSLSGVNNNPNFKLKVEFIQGAGGTVGNNRFDNFTLDAVSLSSADVNAPTAVFSPLKNALDLSITVTPTITFNENIRLINNTAVTSTNLDTIVVLKKDDAKGAVVPFTSAIVDKVVTITPVNSLDNNQNYFLYIKPNVIEDLSDNAITDTLFSNFKTISVQTIFNAGDLVPVAYRMNAISTEDEIALLTLVNILPGTKINLADAKYTTSIPAQCAGGIVWTAPANGVASGSVISIQTSAGVANIGSISGATFGLSSSGDQVIVYTGTNSNPNFITALSSNAWDANNIACSGSISKLPVALTDGVTSINLSNAADNVAGNTANAFYQGPQNLPLSQIRDSILKVAYWSGAASGTAPQTWPSWAFDGPPVVETAIVLTATSIQIVFNKDLDNASATALANYTGIANLTTVTRTNNGTLKDTLVLTYSTPFTSATSYKLTVSNVKASDMKAMFAPYEFSFIYNTSIKLQKSFVVIKEDAGTFNFVIEVENPSDGSFALTVKPAPFSTANAGTDFNLTSQTINITSNSNTINIAVPIIDDLVEEQDEYFVLEISNLVGAQISGEKFATLYIKDNDKKAPKATKELELLYKKSFDPSTTGSTCEIVVYDSSSKQLFATSAIENRFDIINFNNPLAPTTVKSISMDTYGGITSIAVKNGILAVASPSATTELDGKVVFFNLNGDFIKEVTVGNLPDMITFSPDGKLVLTANEGQPTVNYSVDPEGSISIIDISGGVANLNQSNVTTLLFTQYNSQESTLMSAGVRKTQKTSTLSQDLEPEYISISDDNKKAWVALQENNAIAEIDLTNKTYAGIWALGTKDWMAAGNGFDASDNNQQILLSSWPVKSFYMPDAIGNFKKDGTNYIVTANEGDEKEYTGLVERTTVGATTYKLDSAKFPHAEILKLSHNLGRFRVSNLNGDTDADGDYDEIFSVGSRSFSIFNADNQSLVYDSKDDLEQITSKDSNFVAVFNADNEGNGAKSRSRAKGPEPEGLVLATINNRLYSFVGLERTGGVMVYNITNPTAPEFVDYQNPRNQSTFDGDNGPEGIIYISNKQSADGKHYIVVANEISGTLGIYEVKVNTPTIGIQNISINPSIYVYPNPSSGAVLNISSPCTGKVINVLGVELASFENAQKLDISAFKSGLYFLLLNNGNKVSFIKE
jgi:hypothetical protein